MNERFPQELRYTETHEWVRAQDDTVEVGITAYALEEIGDLTYMELPHIGSELRKGEPMGLVESVKDTFDFFAPVSGRVIGVHTELTEQLDRASQEPYGEGWLVRIRMSDPAELDSLLDAESYASRVSKS